MRIRPIRRLAAAAAGVVLTSGLVLGVGAPAAQAAETTDPNPGCSEAGTISRTLASGTAWSMCYHVDSKKGLVLEAVYVKGPQDAGYRRVLDSIALAQLNVPYDTGESQWNDITTYGFGNEFLQKLDPSECPDGELIDVEQAWAEGSSGIDARVRTIPAICVQETAAGLGYRSHEQDWGSIDDTLLFTQQSTELVISTVSKVDWYEYSTQYRLSDTGTVTARLGATGDISPGDFAGPQYAWPLAPGEDNLAVGHHHSALWRVDFGIDESGAQAARYFDSEVTGQNFVEGQYGEPDMFTPILETTVTDVPTEVNLEMTKRRVYNVYAADSLNEDGVERGYDIEFMENNPYEGIDFTEPELTFSEYRECERFASYNLDEACPNLDVIDYADGETITDPVAWVNVGFHHQVRNEDQSPMAIHWQGFRLVARDFWHMNPLTPLARDCVNGQPGGSIHSDEACGHATGTSLTLSSTTQQHGGTPATATVSVAQLAEAGGTPTGTVSIVSGDTLVATGVPLVDGTATLPLPGTLAAGAHELVAVFAPEDPAAWISSTSEPVPFTVTPAAGASPSASPSAGAAPTTTAFTLAKSRVRAGKRARLTASVTGATGGSVWVFDQGALLGMHDLAGDGTATVTLPRLKPGKHRITVEFVGTDALAGSVSAAQTLRVLRRR